MRKIADIHVFEDEGFLARMRSLSATVLMAGVLTAILWALAMVALREFFDAPVTPFELGAVLGSLGDRLMGVEDTGRGVDIRWWISLVVAIPATFAIHELVHALFFRHYAPPGAQITFGSNLKMGMIYASAEGVVYPRDAYLVIALAPSVIVTLLVVVLGIGFRWPLWTIVVATAHLSGAPGIGGMCAPFVPTRPSPIARTQRGASPSMEPLAAFSRAAFLRPMSARRLGRRMRTVPTGLVRRLCPVRRNPIGGHPVSASSREESAYDPVTVACMLRPLFA